MDYMLMYRHRPVRPVPVPVPMMNHAPRTTHPPPRARVAALLLVLASHHSMMVSSLSERFILYRSFILDLYFLT